MNASLIATIKQPYSYNDERNYGGEGWFPLCIKDPVLHRLHFTFDDKLESKQPFRLTIPICNGFQ